jgi:hypothetical protein
VKKIKAWGRKEQKELTEASKPLRRREKIRKKAESASGF